MGDEESLKTVTNIWELVMLLPKDKNKAKSTKNLRIELIDKVGDLSTRTVERYLKVLEQVFSGAVKQDGVNSENEKKGINLWYWDRHVSAGIPGITITEALSIQFIENLLRPLLPDAMLESLQTQFRQAEKALGTNKHQASSSNWPDKIRNVPPTLSMIPPEIKSEVLHVILEAVLQAQQLEIVYEGANNTVTTFKILHPIGLVQRGHITYLIANAFDYTDARFYPLHRIKRARLNGETSTTTQSLDEYVKTGALQFGSGEPIALNAWISKGLAYYLSEAKLSKDQQLIAHREGYILSATVDNTWQLDWWLLSQGAEIVVLEPEWLQLEIVAKLRQATALYSQQQQTKLLTPTTDSSTTPVKIWKIAPGEDACYWDLCYAEGHICIGWSEYGTIKHYDSFDELLDRVGWPKARTCSTLWNFCNTLQVGDLVLANQGRNAVKGIGIITSHYRYIASPTAPPRRPQGFNNLRRVKWLTNQTLPLSGWYFDAPTVCNLGVELYETTLIGDTDGNLVQLLQQWGLTLKTLQQAIQAVRNDYESDNT